MVLVDTSVLIGYLKGQGDPKTMLFEEILEKSIPYGISALTYQEVLQGAKDEQEYQVLKDYLSTQRLYYINPQRESYEQSAAIFFRLRRKGITPRSTIDVLIVATAIKYNLALLYNDRDFDLMGEHLPELRILKSL